MLTNAVQGAGVAVTTPRLHGMELFLYTWLTTSMLVAYAARWLAGRWHLALLPKVLIQIAGYGAFLSAVTVAAYVREIQGAGLVWDKTVKTGKMAKTR